MRAAGEGKRVRRVSPHCASAPLSSSPSSSSSPASSSTIELHRQVEDWDCGLACALMVLRALGVKGKKTEQGRLSELSLATLHAECPWKSVWTIDLAFILRSYGTFVRFLTAYPGVNPSYGMAQWYEDSIRKDEKRVMKRFAQAATSGISVEKKKTGTKDFVQLLKENKNFLIVLVDRTKLICSICAKADPKLIPKHLKTQMEEDSFIGHFVVVTKISQEKKDTIGLSKKNEYFDTSLAWPKIGNEHIVWYLDPGIDVSRNHECCSCLPEFETARLSIGTDQDLLLVPR